MSAAKHATAAAALACAALLSACSARVIPEQEARDFVNRCNDQGGNAVLVYNRDMTVNSMRCVALKSPA